MVVEPRRIKVDPGSDLARILAEAAVAPVVLDKEGELYRLDRMEKEKPDIWKDYDPEKVREALRQAAGTLAGVDTKQLLQDIHAARSQASRGRPAH